MQIFSIGELSRRTSVKIPTIRYYEKIGLIEAPERSSGNQRRYSKKELECLLLICHMRKLSLPIEDIRKLLQLSQHPEKSCTGAHEIASHHLSFVQEQIARLKHLECELKRIAAISDTGHIAQCRVIQALADHTLCSSEH